jgi:hypothetical protein
LNPNRIGKPAAALTGCMDTNTKITVKPDGRGTIEKTIVLSSHLAEFVQSMGMKMDRASIEQGMLNEEGLRTEAAQASVPEYLTFAFTKGTPAVLTITEPKVQRPTTGASSGKTATDPAQLASLKPLYSDLRIALSIKVQRKIIETNAAYASASTVTLMDMDFGVILADDATVKKPSANPTQPLAEVEALVKSLPEVKLDTQETVKIAFK